MTELDKICARIDALARKWKPMLKTSPELRPQAFQELMPLAERALELQRALDRESHGVVKA